MGGRLWSFRAFVVGAIAVANAGGCASHRTVGGATLRVAETPHGADSLTGVEWIRVPVPTGGTLWAAIARPPHGGSHAVLVILHGTHGFGREYVQLARELAQKADVVTVTGCWFAGRRGAGTQFITPIDCPEAPPLPSGTSSEALDAVGALVSTARRLPGVRADRVVLLGHSRGGVAALYFALERSRSETGLRAIVLNSTAYPPELLRRASELAAPVLMFHGTADSPAEGGSEMTVIARARAFEAALAAAGRTVQAEYFDGADHSSLFRDVAQRERTVRHVVAFLREQGIK